MKKFIEQELLTNWHFMRWVALVLGSFFVFQAFRYWDVIPAVAGMFFLYQAITNSGCLVARTCEPAVSAVPDEESQTGRAHNVTYTEIKES
ncbi:hypothetical protein [Fodinibius sediminis]|uniref:DUF2892 domain-containing protein n=1 Tax=Fodinibius sediminis TaxID=1214077 RepID=A0A521BKL1_9BACT|nr:hypothetical protein [Fodinibius sediminis]SMO47629.1 hypothetical protein SAMN06265218_103189 [Fodinibius sediminis]